METPDDDNQDGDVDKAQSPKRIKLNPEENNRPQDSPSKIPANVPSSDVSDAVPLSKRAQKKLVKLAQWEVKKKDKRLKEREKYRQKRAEAVALGLPRTTPGRKALKHNTMAASSNKTRIVIDLDFDDLMIDKDISKTAKQLLWVYTINRKAAAPLQLSFTSLRQGGRVQQVLAKNDGYLNWDINIRAESYDEVFETDRLVYLTSDSDNVLTELNAEDVYVIGGLVDHNHHKGLSMERAGKKGLRTARLPLGEHVKIKTRTVLTIVHVFDIMLRVSEGQSWATAIMGVLPMRKGAIALESISNDDDRQVEPSIDPELPKECGENRTEEILSEANNE